MAKQSAISKQPSGDSDLLQQYLGMFQTAWKYVREYFDRANDDVALFEQEIDLNSPTQSDITLAQARLFVDQMLPPLYFSQFGSDNPFELIPGNRAVSFASARKVRDWVLYNMLVNMKIETRGYLTIKDAVKLGCGYGIIEPILITPPSTRDTVVFAGNEEIRARSMAMGEPVMIPSYTYIPFGQVIPMPDGRTPDDVSCTFVLRFYPENVFRRMLDKKTNPNTPFTGDIDAIVKYARANVMDGYVRTPRMIAAQIANRGKPTNDMLNVQSGRNAPVSIPVLQCYAPNEHVWFACDRFVVYHKKSRFQTLRSPVIKATFDPDGDNWFTPGIINPRKRMIVGTEMLHNALMDILTMYLHPHQVVNRDAVLNAGEIPDLQPYGRTMITGAYKTGDVLSFVTPPQIPPFLVDAGNRLDEFNTSSVGQPKSLHGQGTAGLVRGGSGAMESLQQSTSGREKLTVKHFENGWYSSVVDHALIMCQMLANDTEYMPELRYNPETGKNDLAWSEIARDDIRQVYQVQLSFTEKMSNQLAEITRKTMIYDRAIQNRYVNPKEAFAMLVGDTKQFRQLTEGVNPEENLAAMQAAAGAGAQQNPLVGGAGISMGGLSV